MSCGIVCYAGKFGVFLKFCRTFGRTILVTSGVSKNKPGKAKVGAISKDQICKNGETLWAL